MPLKKVEALPKVVNTCCIVQLQRYYQVVQARKEFAGTYKIVVAYHACDFDNDGNSRLSSAISK